jgi:hypothetical protein
MAKNKDNFEYQNLGHLYLVLPLINRNLKICFFLKPIFIELFTFYRIWLLIASYLCVTSYSSYINLDARFYTASFILVNKNNFPDYSYSN